MQKIPETHSIGETGGNSRCSFDNHTHSLPFHFNADDLNINDLNVCILKSNLKIINRKLTELKLLLVFKPISLVSIETVSHDIFTRLGF